MCCKNLEVFPSKYGDRWDEALIYKLYKYSNYFLFYSLMYHKRLV